MHFYFIIYHSKSSCSIRLQYLLVSWKFTRITASLSLHIGRFSNEKSVEEKWDFGTSWNWCKMKIVIMLSLFGKLHIWKYFSSQETREKQTKTIWKCALFLIWENLHHLRRIVSFNEAADHPATTKINVPPQTFLCFMIR